MFSFLYHLQQCHTCNESKFKPFQIEGQNVGSVTHEVAALLSSQLPTDFSLTNEGIFRLASRHNNFATRTEALLRATDCLSVHYKTPKRVENYAVVAQWGDEPLAELDRCAVPWFGVRGFGVHVNGFVRKEDGLYLWVGERAANRQVDPSKLDNIIGGGLPIGLTIEENLIKESFEEAGFDKTIALTAKPAGTLSYRLERLRGIRNDTLFVFDLELPENTPPKNTDGEVAAFHLWPIAKVMEVIRTTDRFKFNCNLVIIDFLDRHGLIPADEPNLAEIRTFLAAYRRRIAAD